MRRLAVFLLAVLLVGCASDEASPPNVVLIVVDTLRADHLGCYGAQRDTSPTADSLAAASIRFERAYAPSSWTSPSVASILTGLYPTTHRFVRPGSALSEEVDTLAEILRDAGFQTAGVISNGHLRAKFGFAQGFDSYSEDEARGHKHVSTEGVTDALLAALDRFGERKEPFFLFALYFDPHYAYVPHPEYGFTSGPVGLIQGSESIQRLRALGPRLGEAQIRFIRDLYDEEIRFTDDGIGRLLGALRERGLDENTVVVLTADHGEEFFERGWLGHVRTLYDELTRVPLVVRAPGIAPGVCPTPVSLVSIVPTLLDLVGLDSEGRGFQEDSLLPLLESPERGSWSPPLSEVDFVAALAINEQKEAHKKAVVARGHKLVRDDVTREIELFDLAADPEEKRNVAADRPELSRELERILDERLAGFERDAFENLEVEITDEELEAMRGLGYLDP